jgi:SAM-dependent methyltransferase
VDDARQHAEATLENRDDILPVLARVLLAAVPPGGLILEVASGTGQHAVFFAPRLAGLRWQPSDPSPEARRSCAAWATHEGAAGVLPPLDLDAAREPWPLERADAVFCANMVHISPWEATLGLLRGAARVLPPGGPLVLYGPYRVDGALAESNAEFDAWLRRRDPRWGVREVRDLEAAATRAGLVPTERVPMPWDNLIVVLRKGPLPPSAT